MEKVQCIFFRKTSIDRLELTCNFWAGQGASMAWSSVSRDVTNGAMCQPIAGDNSNGWTSQIPIAGNGGMINDSCLEDLTLINLSVNPNPIVVSHYNAGSNTRGAIWRGTLQPGQRLRYRETTGFVVV
jgi:hypothetical protein